MIPTSRPEGPTADQLRNMRIAADSAEHHGHDVQISPGGVRQIVDWLADHRAPLPLCEAVLQAVEEFGHLNRGCDERWIAREAAKLAFQLSRLEPTAGNVVETCGKCCGGKLQGKPCGRCGSLEGRPYVRPASMGDIGPDYSWFSVEVGEEVLRAEAKWPDESLQVRALALCSEAGECAQAVTKKESVERIQSEAIQAGATAFRLFKSAGGTPKSLRETVEEFRSAWPASRCMECGGDGTEDLPFDGNCCRADSHGSLDPK